MTTREERAPIVLENEGKKIFGIFHKPVVSHKVPVIMVCHGLAGNKIGKYRLYVTLASLLVKAGFAVFRFDFRGSGDSEGEFADTTVTGQLSDALKVLEFLDAHPYVDSSRMGIFGRSFGGTVGIMAAEHFKKIKSLVLWAPMFNGDDWMHMWKLIQSGSLPKQKQMEIMRFEGQQGSYAFFEQFFKIRLDQSIKALDALPLLHIHGQKDDVIPIHQADFFAESRKHALGETKFIRLPDGDHDFLGIADQEMALKNTVEWFQKTL